MLGLGGGACKNALARHQSRDFLLSDIIRFFFLHVREGGSEKVTYSPNSDTLWI
jgi:hypothetical protein